LASQVAPVRAGVGELNSGQHPTAFVTFNNVEPAGLSLDHTGVAYF